MSVCLTVLLCYLVDVCRETSSCIYVVGVRTMMLWINKAYCWIWLVTWLVVCRQCIKTILFTGTVSFSWTLYVVSVHYLLLYMKCIFSEIFLYLISYLICFFLIVCFKGFCNSKLPGCTWFVCKSWWLWTGWADVQGNEMAQTLHLYDVFANFTNGFFRLAPVIWKWNNVDISVHRSHWLIVVKFYHQQRWMLLIF